MSGTGQTSGPHRPRGLPAAAIPAFVCLYLLLGGVPALALMVSGYVMASSADCLMGNFLPYIAIVSLLMLVTITGLRRGDLWGVRLFRGLAWLLIGLIAAVAAAGLALSLGYVGRGHVGAPNTGTFVLVMSAVCCIPAAILLQGLYRVRWLDPSSAPQEWEPPVAGTPR